MTYRPSKLPTLTTVKDVADYLETELQRLAEALTGFDNVQFLEQNVEPVRPRTAMVAFADGTNWVPGTVRGFFYFDGTDNLWHPLSSGGIAPGSTGDPDDTYDAGTITTGTLTLDRANGKFQQFVNDGAFILDTPTWQGFESGTMVAAMVNGASAGVVDTSGFQNVSGDPLTTVENDYFFFLITSVGDTSLLQIFAMGAFEGFLLLEDGGQLLLEDGTGFLLLE